MMLPFALNHMTVARLGFAEMLDLSERLGLVGIELRNDLPQVLFDGLDPALAGEMARARGLRILAVAEVKRFNDWSADKSGEALRLMKIARAAGAEAVSLIPRNDGLAMGNGERQAKLRVALKELKPMLEDHGLTGLIEPLGFPVCALRDKAEAVEAIEALDGRGCLRIVHDTFHHALAGGGPFFPDHTGIVHISGVADPAVPLAEMQDAHRVLVDGDDRLGNAGQIHALRAAGYQGPISFECFAPEVHALADPEAAIRRSAGHVEAAVRDAAA